MLRQLCFGLALISLVQVVHAAEVLTPQERAYFQTWTAKQDSKFPRVKRNFTLDNGLEVLLIEDSRAKKAVAALDVAIGEANDPSEFPGLAHYLEHMLFVSTEKYPELNGFDHFASQNNGSNNAYTDTYHTNYFFDVSPSALREGLDRFGQFFISPTFNPSQLAKELEAVDAEYQKNIQQDVWGLNHILNQTAEPQHPKSKDFQGNKTTLSGVNQANIRQFFEANYSAHLMKLVVIAPNPISEVEGWVRTIFSGVKRNPNAHALVPTTSFLPKAHLPRMITYKGSETQMELSLEFEVPAFEEYRYSSPHAFIHRLLSSDRPGMLRERLMKRGWISGLNSRDESLGSTDLLAVDFQLTDLGHSHWKEIVSEFFQTVSLLRAKGLPQYIYEETQFEGELHFLNSAPPTSMDRASVIASRLRFWPADELEGVESLSARYDASSYLKILESIRPDQMQIVMTDLNLHGGQADPLYAIEYLISAIDERETQAWKALGPHSELVFPAPNTYLPKDFSLRGVPHLKPNLYEAPGSRLWVQTDHQFSIPKVEWTIQALSEAAPAAREQAVQMLYLAALQVATRPVTSLAESFGYDFSIGANRKGYSIQWSGFSDSLARFVAETSSYFHLAGVSEAEFKAIQEELLKEIDDELSGEPSSISSSRFYHLVTGTLTQEDLKAELSQVTLEEVKTHAKQFWEGPLFLHAGGFGNLTHLEAQQLLEQFKVQVNHTLPLTRERVELQDYVAFEKKSALVHEVEVKDQNHGVVHYLSFGKSTTPKKMALAAIEQVLAAQFFKELRTEGQIGYVASLGQYVDPGQCGLRVLVQSSWPVEKIDSACLQWLDTIPARISALSEESFARIQASLLEVLEKPPVTFEEKAHEMLAGIFRFQENLDWKQAEIQALKELERSDVANFVAHKLEPIRRRMLSVYALGSPESGSDAESVASDTLYSRDSKKARMEEQDSPHLTDSRARITTQGWANSARKYWVKRFR